MGKKTGQDHKHWTIPARPLRPAGSSETVNKEDIHVNSFNPFSSSVFIDNNNVSNDVVYDGFSPTLSTKSPGMSGICDNISCYYTNADQFLNKRAEFSAAMEIHSPEIVGITEIKPKNGRYKVEESEITMDNYESFHNLNEEGRGIVLFIHNKLQPSLCTTISNDFSEHIITECKLQNNEKLLICLVYRRQDLPKENADNLNTLLEQISSYKATHKLIFGDFNYPELNWNTETSNASEQHIATKFLQATKDALLIQHQKTPTRFREGQRSNTLDLILTDSEELVQELKVDAPLGKSDHYSLIFTLSVSYYEVKKLPRRNYRKTNVTILKDELKKVNWNQELENKDTNETWLCIKSKISDAINKSTPMTRPPGKQQKKWMNSDTLESVREKHRLFREWHKSGNDSEKKTPYNKANNKARKECRRANREYERKIAEESKKNPKMFFQYVNSKVKSKSGIADLNKEDGSKTKNDTEKAELLNSFFQSVFTIEDDGPLPDFENYDFENELKHCEVTTSSVKKILSGLNKNKASGPDEIPPSILSEAAEELTEPITLLFRRSLESGTLPSEWKMAHVSPIYKKGNKAAVNNYRPVSLTCVLCKVLEKFVRESILNHLMENNIITPHQHGFVPGRSCITQLLESLDEWTRILEDNGSVDIIYTDFQKAFDSVPHKRIAQKLNACGIRGSLLDWIVDFLAERKQKVVINGCESTEGRVTSGIPQGSVLGPLLFVIYINDLPRGLNTTAKMFADDTKVFVRSDNEEGAKNLQKDLDSLQTWSDKWLLRFHPDKCCHKNW